MLVPLQNTRYNVKFARKKMSGYDKGRLQEAKENMPRMLQNIDTFCKKCDDRCNTAFNYLEKVMDTYDKVISLMKEIEKYDPQSVSNLPQVVKNRGRWEKLYVGFKKYNEVK